MSNAIEVRGLSYRAGRSFSLSDVSLNVPTGAIYGFLGPNGAGKTTTVRLLLGMTRRDAGEVRLLGRDISVAIRSNALRAPGGPRARRCPVLR